jgi:hypothetical protein
MSRRLDLIVGADVLFHNEINLSYTISVQLIFPDHGESAMLARTSAHNQAA